MHKHTNHYTLTPKGEKVFVSGTLVQGDPENCHIHSTDEEIDGAAEKLWIEPQEDQIIAAFHEGMRSFVVTNYPRDQYDQPLVITKWDDGREWVASFEGAGDYAQAGKADELVAAVVGRRYPIWTP